MNAYTYFDGLSGAPLVRLNQRAVDACSHAGSCDADVAYWVTRVEWLADRATLERTLKEFGAWDDLSTVDEVTLRERALWCGATAIAEEPDVYREEGAQQA